MRREFSAGGVLVQRLDGRWHVAAIRPAGKPAGLWALPKGHVDGAEDPRETAVREVEEETGVRGEATAKLGDVKYFYVRDGVRIFKIVSFYLVHYVEGALGELPEAFRHEVADTRWLPLDEAPKLLAYKGEREMAEKALIALSEGGV